MDCLFCAIIKGTIPSKKVYEDGLVYAFRDINPQAPTHILVIPKQHISSSNELQESNDNLTGYMLRVCAKIANDENIKSTGYRVVTNCGPDAGQSVPHIHFHILGGRLMAWPPG